MTAFPGNLDNAADACGACHADKVQAVRDSPMHTGRAMVATTRQVFGERTDRPGHNDLQHLTRTPADSLLRKLCASCHLGHAKTAHRLDPTHDRGGGCLACHIDHYPERGHPALTARVSDARCFGCHSRSGRIALNYAGLAETDSAAAATGRLDDGRLVEQRAEDRHHAAGMACIDCHTARDLMGLKPTPSAANAGVDIRCQDCHRITRTIELRHWPPAWATLVTRIPYPAEPGTRVPVTRNGTPLWHIELRDGDAWLHRKDGQGVLRIPPYRDADHPLAAEHARLDCPACHAGWAPQCYGCHLRYEPQATQYDHQEQRQTPGRWQQQRSDVRNTAPPLGVTAGGRIGVFVPAMIMQLEHPDWPAPRLIRRFATLEPHTTGPARGCASCHRSSVALGLGQGQVQLQANGRIRFRPRHQRLADGLPADAWTGPEPGEGAQQRGAGRPFQPAEMQRILAVPLEDAP